jgi:membrane-bound lytic murein transglycosylase D
MGKTRLFLIIITLFVFSCAGKKITQEQPLVKQPQVESSQPETTTPGEASASLEGAQAEGSEQELNGEDLDYFDHEKELQRALSEGEAGPTTFDIPIVMNERVEWWVNYFQTVHRKHFKTWLERSERYIPMMKRILRENGLPEDLVYLAMIESGFTPYARSRARAVGPWQFIARTGARYGLKANWAIDERRDPEKSTIAAAQHLKDLHDEFEHWYLAAAGYNAGAGKIKRAIEKYSTEDFWEMSKFRYLRKETKDYVPKMIAAALIAKSPEKYGFSDLIYELPLEYDKVSVEKPTDLRSVAEAMEVPLEELKSLNPELLRWFTPPDYPNYELKIPKGSTEKYLASQTKFRSVMVSSTVQHRLRSGETLSHVAKSYGTSLESLLAFNSISNPRRIRSGQVIYVPVRAGIKPKSIVTASSEEEPRIDVSNYKKMMQKDGAIGYSVKMGDTIWSISRAFNVTVKEIRNWNRLGSVRMIHPGDKLVIYPKFLNGNLPGKSPSQSSQPTSKNAKFHRVKKGDTLWSIAKSYNVPVARLISLNRLDKTGSSLHTGKVIKLVN